MNDNAQDDASAARFAQRLARQLQTQATRQWSQLEQHEDGQTIGDDGQDPAAACRARGWNVVAPGPVTVATNGSRRYVVGLRNGRAWAVPAGDIE